MLSRLIANLLPLALCCAAAAQTEEYAARVRQGNQLMRTGKYAEAAAIYRELSATHPQDAGLLGNLGIAEHLAGKHGQAVQHLEAALRLQPANPPALIMLGSSYLQLGEFTRSAAALQRAAVQAPEMKEPSELLTEVFTRLGKHEEAARAAQQWTALDPHNPKAWYGLGRCYEALAQEEFNRLAKAAPESGHTVAVVARQQQEKGQLRSAFHLYRDALRREPRLRGIHLAIAEIYDGVGHADWAAVERSRESESGEPDCRAQPQACAFVQGKYEEAAAAALHPSLEARYWRVRALGELTRNAFQRVEGLGDSVEFHAIRAAAQRELGRHADSIREWRAALALSPGNPVIEKELAVTLRLNEDYAGAREIVERLTTSNPKSAELNYLFGQILLNQQQPAAAIRYLTRATTLEPAFLPARSSLGLALVQLNREQEAMPHLKAALPLDTDGSLHFRFARACQKAGDAASAKQALARYRELQARAENLRGEAARQAQITAP